MADSTHPSLLVALQNPEDREAWERFRLRYEERIRVWCECECRLKGLVAADVKYVTEEVTQNLVAEIHAKMAHFDLTKREHVGAYRHWLRTVTCNALRTYLHRREQERGSGDSVVLTMMNNIPAQERLAEEIDTAVQMEVLQEAMRQVLANITERDQQIFRLLGAEDGRREGAVSAAQVAEQFGITVAATLKVKSKILLKVREVAKVMLAQLDEE